MITKLKSCTADPLPFKRQHWLNISRQASHKSTCQQLPWTLNWLLMQVLIWHISEIKSCSCHLGLLGKLQPFLTQDAANVIAVSLIMSRLDYCNSTLCSLPANQLNLPQKIQNVAAHTMTRKSLGITSPLSCGHCTGCLSPDWVPNSLSHISCA